MASKSALVLIDVYNDFLHPNGKLTGALAESLKDSNTIKHIEDVLQAARKNNLPIYYSLHQQYRDGKYTGFERWNAMLESVQQNHGFEEGSFGAEVYASLEPKIENGDTVISKHWNQRLVLITMLCGSVGSFADFPVISSFKNTDLDWLLRQRNITHLVFAGLVVNSCIETTAREANEL
jgi:nicotinamidase-related amidase